VIFLRNKKNKTRSMIYGFFRELARVEGIIVKQLSDLVKSITDRKIFLRVRTISLPLGQIGGKRLYY
jgi:hypothetical protein